MTLFLRNGYARTSMDQVAADARVSKQTVYKQFADKETLFRAVAAGVSANSRRIIEDLATLVATHVSTSADLSELLRRVARAYLDGVLEPRVLALRRLVISEADRFPELADEYYQQAQVRGLELIESAVRRWAAQGLLAVATPSLAASHFAYLALGRSLDHALFHPGQTVQAAERTEAVQGAVDMFLAAYGRR